MEVVPIDLFGVHIEVPFLAPLGYRQAGIDDFAAKVCDTATGLGIRPENVRLKKWDDLYGYELIGQFFGDNGQLTRTPERIKLFVRNARTQGDWNIIQQTLTRFYVLSELSSKTTTNLSAHVHAKFPSSGERDEWLNQFSHNALLSKPAALGYVRIFDWEKDIRVMIEPSNVVQDAVFIAWDTQYTNGETEWDAFFASLPTMMENSANIFDIGFEPFRERV